MYQGERGKKDGKNSQIRGAQLAFLRIHFVKQNKTKQTESETKKKQEEMLSSF